jgi:hypothetical protein
MAGNPRARVDEPVVHGDEAGEPPVWGLYGCGELRDGIDDIDINAAALLPLSVASIVSIDRSINQDVSVYLYARSLASKDSMTHTGGTAPAAAC